MKGGTETASLKKRITSALTALLLLVFIFVSAYFAAKEVHHECIGDDCPVCAVMAGCEETARGLAFGACCVSVFIFILAAVIKISCRIISFVPDLDPVTLKIRLNN